MPEAGFLYSAAWEAFSAASSRDSKVEYGDVAVNAAREQNSEMQLASKTAEILTYRDQ